MQSLLSSCASILLLGEANFSFSLSLKKMLPPSVTMVTSCYQSEDRIPASDPGIPENIAQLQSLGARVLYGVDATQLGQCSSLEGAIYDAVIFNFPHVGGKSNIGKNRELLKQFFECCFDRLSPSGQVFLTLCTGQGGTPADKPQRKWADSWQAVAMAAWGSFILTRTMPFCAEDYKEYYCTGYRSQSKHFLTQNAITHVFERSRELLDQPCPIPRELTLRTDQEMSTVQCPTDLCRVINRDLLSEPHHPLALVSAEIHRLINEGFADTTFLQAEEQPLVLNAGEVITTGNFSPSELYHVDVVRTKHIQQQDSSHCSNRSVGVPQGAVHSTTTELHKQPPLSPEDVQGLSPCTCAVTALGKMVTDGQSDKDSMSDRGEKQDGLLYLEGHSKHGNTGTEQSSCQHTEDSESNGPHVTGITSAEVQISPCLSKHGKSNYVLRPTLLSRAPGIFRKEDPQPLYASGRVFRRCGIRPELYPILHQYLMVVPIPKDSGTSSEDFKEKVSRVSAGLLQEKGPVSIEDCHSCQDGSINNRSSLVFKVEGSNEPSQNTLTIGEFGIFHSEGGGYHYCIWNLDTMAMVKYSVEDIRLFWSADDRIVAQFSKSAEMCSESQPLLEHSMQVYSLHPPTYTYDVSFWLHEDTFDELDFCSAIRSVTFDLVREVRFLSQYINREISYLYRIVYQSCDRALTKKAVTQLHLDVREAINKRLGVEAR
eukprot:XP_791314.1 PREDICTED: ferredoxin-fold anticodon-binding domain-containing protein 1 homolog [Strongylocentrotus purpuratus]